jgi:hypothetical protein
MSDLDNKLDEKTSSAWHAASREQPPPAIDAALRAAARRAVSAGPARSRHMQSWPLLAAAIVAFLAIGILQTTPPEEVTPGFEADNAMRSPIPRRVESGSAAPEAPALESPSPATTAPAPPLDSTKSLAGSATAEADRRGELTASATQRAPERKKTQSPVPASEVDALKEKQARANDATPAQPRVDAGQLEAAPKAFAPPSAAPAPSPPPAPEPFPATPPVAASAPAAAGNAARNAQTALSAQRGALAPAAAPDAAAPDAPAKPERAAEQAPPPASLAKSATSEVKDAPKPPDEWIKLIRRLRSEGHNDEALRELTAFRAAYKDRADELLPADLRSLR